MKRIAIIAALCALTAGSAFGLPQMGQGAPQAGTGAEMARPDVAAWPTVGTTLRLDREHGTTPWQMRQVLMEPQAFARLRETRAYPDGATFAVLFYDVARDDTYTPPFYAATNEVGFVLEVIDRSHADGRRFYTFAPGATTARAPPAGNQCAVCHNERGSFDGTFASHYPTIRSIVAP